MENRPRIKPFTNKRMDACQFVYSWFFIRGWSLDAKVNALRPQGAHAFRRLQSQSQEELRPFVGRTLLPSVLDRAIDRLVYELSRKGLTEDEVRIVESQVVDMYNTPHSHVLQQTAAEHVVGTPFAQ